MLINHCIIKRYTKLLDEFEASVYDATHDPTPKQVLNLFVARDAVQNMLDSKMFRGAVSLEKVRELDERLKRQGDVIAGMVKLADYRATVRPPPEAWWWFFDTKISVRWRWANFFLNGLTSVLLIISMGFLVDIGLRFLTDRFDLITILPVFIDVMVGALIGTVVFRVRLTHSTSYWQGAKFLLAGLFLCLVYYFHQDGLPRLADWYHAQARADLKVGQLQGAQAKYQVAINLDPTFVEAHYNLGSLSEELFDFDRARTEYRLAAVGGFDAAYNNLARLHILEEQYSAAVTLLLKGLDVVEQDEVRYDMLKNLAWARVAQDRHAEALPYLTKALTITKEKAPAHCLLAQVLDVQEKNVEALTEWENCLRLGNERNPDEDLWIGMARTRLINEGNE